MPLIFYDEDDLFGESSFALYNIVVLGPKRQEFVPFKINYLPHELPSREGIKGWVTSLTFYENTHIRRIRFGSDDAWAGALGDMRLSLH